MGEIKSVKVDNWGVFFLQKLQNFFNKTDYCDLTLQFRDNSQLKVHRLVLSACTDYFNVLEQTCEVVDDAIIMPKGLQADVVVPIVNFMYTGTLEFELKMYNRLLRTAKDMNMTVLLKLLEAHRRTMEMHPQKASGQASPKPRRRVPVAAPTNISSSAGGRSLIQTNQGGRLAVGVNVNSSQNRNISTSNMVPRVGSSGSMPVRQIGSTTFTRIKVENETHETGVPTSASGGYSLIKQAPQQQQPASPFEQLRKGYNSNKRPAVSTFVSPPAKKPNLEDVKEFAEQQRMRKQIAAEYGDDDYDASNIMDDDTIHNDDDDDEMASSSQNQMSQTASAGVQTVAASSNQQQPSEDPPGTTTIIVKHEGPDKPPTIVVKDSANSKMNHAKIISEVLRQYPHLIKSNKNIKLKIMPNVGGQTQKIIVKKDALEAERQIQSNKGPSDVKISDNQLHQQQQSAKTLASNILATRPKTMQQSEISPTGKSNNSEIQAATNKSAAASGSSATTNVLSTAQPQKRRIDSKTMHALIALGAENTAGPWLCLRCGRNGHPISIPSYRGFRRHLINTHKEVIDPALCEHCGWRSAGKRELHFHMQLEHKIKTNLYIFPKCQLCQQMCIDSDGLNRHLIESHPDENKQQCIYCNKIFPEELQLYTHMKTFHKKQALEDGIIDYSDDENQAQPDLPPLLPDEYNKELEQEQKDVNQTKKINILSDISLPIASSIIKNDSFEQQHESTTTEEYLQDQVQDDDNTETKFVAADGSEMILTAEQRKEILSQLNQEHEGVVMVLNESHHHQQSDHGAISHDETSQATTATNEERQEEEEEEERVAEDEEQIAEDDQNNDNQIYNEMKSLHSNLEDDSTSQTETGVETTNVETPLHGEDQEELDDAEHEKRDENMEESKESADNLEWAENLISEHDLDDEVSSQTANENIKINKPEENEEEIKDDDNKSQDEISKKLKELTGDWSEDDDDMTEEDPTENMLKMKDGKEEKSSTVGDVEFSKEVKGKGNVMSEMENVNETNEEFDDHAELLASLQNSDRDESVIDKSNEKLPVVESENIDEDDIDKALESLHKENVDDELNTTVEEKEKMSKVESDKEEIKMPIKETVLESAVKASIDEGIKEKYTSAESEEVLKDEENPEEKLVKEIETIDEPEPSSSTMEVDEETKKNLIDSLLGEQAEPIEDTGIETATEALKLNLEISLDKDIKSEVKGDAPQDESNTDHSKEKLEKYEEYSDITPEKEVSSTDNVSSTVTSDIAESTTTAEVVETSSTITKKESNLTSEERVKSLISEWGDDEDEEDNLPANL